MKPSGNGFVFEGEQIAMHLPTDDDKSGKVKSADAQNWPHLIFEKLREFDVRHVPYVPDSGHARLIELCHAASDMKPTVLTTEEEGIGILAGAWLGGERGVLLMQSSGVGNCINTLSLAKVCGFPLLMIVTMRGEWGEMNPWQVPMGQIAADTLRLAGAIVYQVTEPELAAPAVEAAARMAFNGGLTVAVLLSQRMVGTKLFKD
jgi:sulfopyruvate decarboxylase alpha subunit